MTSLWLRDEQAAWLGPSARRLGNFWRTINLDVRPAAMVPWHPLGRWLPAEFAMLVHRFSEHGDLDASVIVVRRKANP